MNADLHKASRSGDEAHVTRLLQKGAQVNYVSPLVNDNAGPWDMQGWTAMHCAAYWGHAQCVETLWDWGASLRARTAIHNMTALHLAAVNGHADVVDMLLDRGAEKDA
ncbi:hypothetical protein GUITHDRAFT_70110, partial [Guillardia theta CCMP2712]